MCADQQSGTKGTRKRNGPKKTSPGTMPRMLGHFELQEMIGRGGMAVVYKGVQPSLNRSVAVKVLPEQFAASPDLLARFEREATIIAQLNHSNIVQVIDRGRQGDILYIVMEYVEGKSLDEVIRERRLAVGKIVAYATQMCDALEYAHNAGVVHRDLKPSNILIDARTERVKIADFGIAALETTGGAVATLTMNNTSLGTMNYMSPEQRIDAHKVTHLTDVFSFGVILYEMLTGELPVGHFKLPSFIRHDVPIGFDTVTKKCLAPNPIDRYQNAREIRDDLVRLSHRTAGLPDIRAISRLSFVGRRQRLIIAGSAAAALLIGVIMLVALRGRSRDAGGGTDQSAGAPPARQVTAEERTRLQADFVRAQGLISQGKLLQAADALEQLLRADPDGPLAAEAGFALAATHHDLRDYEKAKLAYERFIRSNPGSPRVPAAIVGKCWADWVTAPRRGLLRNARDAGLQSRIIDELREVIRKHPGNAKAAEAYRLMAEVAEAPDLSDWKTAAAAYIRLHELGEPDGNDALYRAAEAHRRQSDDVPKTVALYERFLKSYPEDRRAADVKATLASLREKTAPAPEK
ncbi:MAG: tetratricopeptide repeat protein [Lentisphaerae bacterium]|nr:tetratricopeptide repeat protein [Lentisphaerota bacterium]